MTENNRIAVIGAGPAGIAAAIQLRRQGFEPLWLEKDRPGGLLRQARWVENYPGFPAGVSGPNLADLFWQQAAAFDLEFIRAEVLSLEANARSLILNTTAGKFAAAALVLASGSRPRQLPPVLRDPRLAGLIQDDLNLVQAVPDCTIAVLGSGDAAFDYALNLAGRGCRVCILVRGDREKCLPRLADSCRVHPGIKVLFRSCPKRVRRRPDQRLGLLLETSREELAVDGLLAAIGRRAEDGLLRSIDSDTRRGLLAGRRIVTAGDVKNGRLRQTALAAGDGIRAAMILARRSEQENLT